MEWLALEFCERVININIYCIASTILTLSFLTNRSFFWGPSIRLEDCLTIYFSEADLKGDNMYSCDKCKKLREGVKYSKILKLPEVSFLHLVSKHIKQLLLIN